MRKKNQRFFYSGGIAAFLLIFGPAQAAQTDYLANGQKIFAFYQSELPEERHVPGCDKYVFLDQGHAPLPNGKYKTRSNVYFLVKNSCIYPQTGNAILSDGKVVEFFQENTFNEDGNLVLYIGPNGDHIPLPDGSYELKDGQTFTMVNGHIENYGAFDDGVILYEDHN